MMRTMKKSTKKLLALLMAASVIFAILPVYSLAASDKAAATEQSAETEELTQTEDGIYIEDEEAPLTGSYKLGMGQQAGHNSGFIRILSAVLSLVAVVAIIITVYKEGRKAAQILREL